MSDLYPEFPPIGSVSDWARILSIHEHTIRKACHNGELGYVTLGTVWKIPRHSVVAWMTRNDSADATNNAGTVNKRNAPAHASR